LCYYNLMKFYTRIFFGILLSFVFSTPALAADPSWNVSYVCSGPDMIITVDDTTGKLMNVWSGIIQTNDPIQENYISVDMNNDTEYIWTDGCTTVTGDWFILSYRDIYDFDQWRIGNNPTTPANTSSYGYVVGSAIVPDDQTSRIITTEPLNKALVSTSTATTIGAEININENDFVQDETFLNINLFGNGCTYSQVSVLTSLPGNSGTCTNLNFQLPITSSGNSTLSTTTDLTSAIGSFTMTISIVRPYFSVFGFSFLSNTVAATTTTFTMGTTTLADIVAEENQQFLDDFNSATSSSSGACNNILTGQAIACLISWFVPNKTQIQQAALTLSDTFETNMPFSFFWQAYSAAKELTASTTPNEGNNVVVNLGDTFIQGDVTLFDYAAAKESLSQIVSTSSAQYIVNGEWIGVTIYLIIRIVTLL